MAISQQSAEVACRTVLARAGASLPNRDSVDGALDTGGDGCSDIEEYLQETS
jgi:hypothetical protein